MTHTYHKHYDEHVYRHTLSSGLTIIALPKPDVKTTYVALGLPFGACQLHFKDGQKNITLPYGSAHFFEHKIYASKDGDMFSKFVKLGLDPNAMTSYDTTTYFFSATKHIYEGIDLLFETLDHSYFTDENISSERSIINEEINMDQDDMMTPLYQKLFENMFFNHPIKGDILGSIESISRINKDTLNWIHQHIYRDDLKVLILSGNIDLKALEGYIHRLEKKRKKITNEVIFHIPDEPFQVVKEKDEMNKDLSMSRLLIGMKLPKIEDELTFHKMKHSIYMALHTMIGDASDAHHQWIDQDLIHQAVQFQITHIEGADHLTIQVPTDHPEILLKEIEQILSRDVKEFLSEKTFLRLKKLVIASNILSLDDQESKMFQYLKSYFKGVDTFQIMDSIKDVKLEDVIKYGNHLNELPKSVLIAKKNSLN